MRTRVIRKHCFKKDCDENCEGKPERSVRKTVPPRRTKQLRSKAAITKETPASWTQKNVSAIRQVLPSESEDAKQQLGAADVVNAHAERHQDAQTSVNRTDNLDIPSSAHREVCEIMLSCTPDTSTCEGNRARLELLKMFLEKKLGTRTAVMAYNVIERLQKEGKAADEVIEEVQRVLPTRHAVYTPLLIHVRGLEVSCMQS